MRSLSGNYPEVWVSYKVLGQFGIVYHHLVKDVHTLELAHDVFTNNPPEIPDGKKAVVVKVTHWIDANAYTEIDSYELPLIGFTWGGKKGLDTSRKATVQ